MRLYLKLAGMILLAAAVQWSLNRAGATASELWFAARCQVANITGDLEMRERLIIEVQHAHHPDFDAPVHVNASAAGN